MAQAGSPDPFPPWLSISGEELRLDDSAGFLGHQRQSLGFWDAS